MLAEEGRPFTQGITRFFIMVDVKVSKMSKLQGKVAKLDMWTKWLILAGLIEGGQDGQDVSGFSI